MKKSKIKVTRLTVLLIETLRLDQCALSSLSPIFFSSPYPSLLPYIILLSFLIPLFSMFLFPIPPSVPALNPICGTKVLFTEYRLLVIDER